MYRFMYSRSQRNPTHNNTSKPKGAPMRRSDGFWTVQDVRIQEFEFETWHYFGLNFDSWVNQSCSTNSKR